MPNLAFLLEPFPLRNSLGAHAWVGGRLCSMLLDASKAGYAVGDFRVICNDPSMAWVVARQPAARPFLVQPAAAVREGFNALIADWHTQGLRDWAAIQLGSPEHETLYEALLRSVRDSYAFDALGYWGTNETLRAVAERMGIPVLWAEYGPLRPPFPTHFCLDARGVNGLASSRQAVTLEPGDGPAEMPGLALETAVGARCAYEAALTLPAVGMDAFAGLMQFTRGHRRVALLVMQLADDANILAFGNGWTCRAMVEAALKQLSGPDTVFVLRPHPGEAASYHNMAAGDAIRALVQDRADVLVFDAEGPDAYVACLSVATEVICINSSVGFEASLLGKPVRVLGDASYTPHAADLQTAPMRVPEQSLRTLLAKHYIPEDEFWTIACWRNAVACVVTEMAAEGVSPPHLPAVAAKVLGKVHDMRDGQLFVEGIGTLGMQASAGPGTVDSVAFEAGASPSHLRVHGWGADPATGGMLAGFLIATDEHSVWCSSMQQRPDVARHFADAGKHATGFAMRIALQDLPSARSGFVKVWGVTAAGRCFRLGEDWAFEPHAGQFSAVAA